MGTSCSREKTTSFAPTRRSERLDSDPAQRNSSMYGHDERMRRTGRRKLIHRHKSFSDPVRPGYGNEDLTQSRGSELLDQLQASRRANAAGVCCAQCTKSGMEWDKYKPSSVVKDYAAVSTQNSKYRKHMEDECVAIPKFKAFHGDPAKSCFFGVYDGHGGAFCSRYAAKNLHTRLSAVLSTKANSKQRESVDSAHASLTSSGSTELSEFENDVLTAEDIENCFTDTFAAIDEELANHDESATCGSTAVTCLIRNFNGRTTFHIANVGDSRAILFSRGQTTRLSVDHRATNEDEAKRIRARNGIIFNKRVAGVISVTRALGQTDEKEFITADPHMQSGAVEENGAFLVLISDGVSDVFSDEDVTRFVSERLTRGEKSITICKSLLDDAKAMGAIDNMTAVLICFSDAAALSSSQS